MEVLVEEDEITPVRVLLKLLGSTVDRAPAVLVLEKDLGQPLRKLGRYLVKRHVAARASRTLDGERIAIIRVVLQQRANDQSVDGDPDRAAPVGIATEHTAVRL